MFQRNITFSLLLLLITKIVETIHFPGRNSGIYSYKDNEMDYYTLVSKSVTDNSFIFVIHYSHKVHFGKIKKLVDRAEYLTLEIFVSSSNTIQFIFRNANETRFELPCEDPFPCHRYKQNLVQDFNMDNSNYDYKITIKERPFSFSLLRKSTSEVIFTTVNRHIIFQDNYAELTTDIPSENLFGLGERTMDFKVKSGTYTFYNKDLYGELEDGSGVGKNRYGSHPMYLMREKSGNYHISYLRNSFPMDIIVNHDKSTLTYKIAGGVLDFSFFLGNNNPETATKLYHKYLGGYSLPPFWAMGFHQCRWGYNSLNMVKEVVSSYQKNKLPLDTIWMDIDYMENYMPFTVDTNRYDLDEFKQMLKSNKKKFVMISEPSMGTKWPTYEYLTKGKNMDIFIKNKEGGYILNKVWPGKCHFIDFFNPKGKDYWEEAMTSLHNKLEYNGVWLDMNEIAAFNNGQMDMYDNVLPCNDDNKYPYIPGKEPFESKTICPNAVHFNGMAHIEVHNYYPNQQSKVTYELLEKMYPDEFPFILTRANAPGIGKYAAHWSGDNYGRFSFYKLSISEVLNFNLFGAPVTGADICGFGENTPENLCAKWYQLGSLYPFSRSHAHLDSYRKEPYKMGKTLLQTTLKSLQFRYSILKYYYYLMMKNDGVGTIFRPLFYEFYDDPNCVNNSVIDNFFMIGNALLVVPNLHDDNSSTETAAYFPKGEWYDLRDYSKINKINSSVGETVQVQTTLNEMPAVFLRSGKTIFTNNIENVLNTYDLDNNFNFIIALDKDSNLSSEMKFSSHGVIPALNNYHSKLRISNCMKNNCYLNIDTDVNFTFLDYNAKIYDFILTISKAEFYDEDYTFISIKKLVIFGIETTNLEVQKTNLDNVIDDAIDRKYEIEIIKDYCFIVKILGDLRLNKQELKILFTLKTS